MTSHFTEGQDATRINLMLNISKTVQDSGSASMEPLYGK